MDERDREALRPAAAIFPKQALKQRVEALREAGWSQLAIPITPGEETALEDWARIKRAFDRQVKINLSVCSHASFLRKQPPGYADAGWWRAKPGGGVQGLHRLPWTPAFENVTQFSPRKAAEKFGAVTRISGPEGQLLNTGSLTFP